MITKSKNIVARILPNSFDCIILNDNQNSILNVTAKGTLKQTSKICVGDYCQIENGVLTKILPRKNKLTRPDCANIDNLVIVVAPKPEPDLVVLDLMLGEALKQNITPIIVVNKLDLPNASELTKKIKANYSKLCKVLEVSAKTGENLNELKKLLTNVTAFGGLSGVGKTSLMNALFNLSLKVGELSKIERGTHTTKESFYYITSNNEIVIDTAGFSNLSSKSLNLTTESLQLYYPDITAKNCKYTSCSHNGDEGCYYNKNKTGRFLRYKELEKNITNFSYKIRKGGKNAKKN